MDLWPLQCDQPSLSPPDPAWPQEGGEGGTPAGQEGDRGRRWKTEGGRPRGQREERDCEGDIQEDEFGLREAALCGLGQTVVVSG